MGRESLKAPCFWCKVCALHPVIRRDAPVAVVPRRATVVALGLRFLELGQVRIVRGRGRGRDRDRDRDRDRGRGRARVRGRGSS